MLLVGLGARKADVAKVKGSLKNDKAILLLRQDTLLTHFEPKLESVSKVRCRLLNNVNRLRGTKESSILCRIKLYRIK